MPALSEGARQLPLRHISIRVPWNDTNWTGVICKQPRDNLSCLILPRIRENRDDAWETEQAGESWENLDVAKLPPCVSEHGHFMAPYELKRQISHPYAETSKAHKHFLPTPFRYPPYSAACLPFSWMLKESAKEKAEQLEIGLQQDLEDDAHAAMGFDTAWMQAKHNQLALLDTFFSAIKPQQSLCFFYAKRTPLLEVPRRVVVGVGRVAHVGTPVEYLYREQRPLTSILWERAVQHSIRPGFADGFLLPYHQLLEYLGTHPEEDPSRFVAFVPDEHFWSFSYGSEHVSNDGAIAALLACAGALQHIKAGVPGLWDDVLRWIDERLGELWRMRGPCPGLGAALTAFGIENGTLLAYELERLVAEREPAGNADPWPFVEALFTDSPDIPEPLRRRIGDTRRRTWQALPAERQALLKLLSRFEITPAQATRYYVHEDSARAALGIDVDDAELLANPYRLYELDRVAPDPVQMPAIDRGLFPDQVIRGKHPLPEPSRVDDATDGRRVRAFTVRELETAAESGDTLKPRAQVIQAIRDADAKPACLVDGDLMSVVEDTFSPVISTVPMADGQPAYQIEKLTRVGQVIRSEVQKRTGGARHAANIPWRQRLDAEFDKGSPPGARQALDQQEEDARTEKAAALAELFAARLSVLIGPAGTGKTTLLKMLCAEPQVKDAGILLLAPTGKARVRLEGQAGVRGAKTIAQFLLPLGRYYGPTGAYRLSTHDKTDAGRTVIIDEASMLTEEQLAAVLDALKGVQRLILVGDPRQLPPIGAGRPFLDIVRQLAPANGESLFPRVGPGYAELTVRRRQVGEGRDDLLLAEWFSGRPIDPGADEIWDRIREGEASKHLKFVRWDDPAAAQGKLLDCLVQELKLAGVDDSKGFELSLGGSEHGNSVYFWAGKFGGAGACAKAEDWQVLSPVRNSVFGVDAINRLLQTTFRARAIQFANQKYNRKVPPPMGPDGIIYGDKVINTQNGWRNRVWPKDDEHRYVANGEIGIVVGQFKTQQVKFTPNALEVEFSSQPGYKYTFGKKDFDEESQPNLDLAYALTVHKTQGSEFRLTMVVLPNPCRLLSRELLYTALTRQADRIVILHQGDLHDLKRYSVDFHSDAARRLTNLLTAPSPIEVDGRFLEAGLIHRTNRGESVRSKSEVIIANELHHKGIDYAYELKKVGPNGVTYYPDFTIDDAASGRVIYWEHLGLLRDRDYRRRWEKKLAWYRAQGILPMAEGGGPGGMLVTTEDDERGGIDSSCIGRVVADLAI